MKGFVDLHTHGIGRYDTVTTNPQDIIRMAELYFKAGTSAVLPTIYAGPIDRMRDNMEAVRVAMQSPAVGAEILGVHLEGPFLNPKRSGALDSGSFIRPSTSNLRRLIDGYEDMVRVMTIAPELPGALEVIEMCASMGIRVNMGHSDATYREALDGKRAGAMGVTHIFNAMRPFHHREPGLVGMALMDEEVYIEVIADNVHLDPVTLGLILRVKPPERIILVSDSVKGAGRGRSGAARRSGVITGSRITLSDAVVNVRQMGVSEETVGMMSVQNPRRYLDLPVV